MNRINELAKNELALIDKELSNLFTNSNNIYTELKHFLESPTKRIRSLITILYLKALGVNPNIDLLVTGELIHNASLLHDDVLDNAKTRRNIPTLWTKFNQHISILSGDFLLSLATERLIKIGNWNVLANFQNCIKKMSEAEILQYSLRNKVPTKEQYLEIIEGKTAELFVAILESSCLISKPPQVQAASFARNFGMLFQLKNDLEKQSASADLENKIYTLKDIIGIEKTKVLMDNYQEEIIKEIKELPQNIYSKGLEDLLGKL